MAALSTAKLKRPSRMLHGLQARSPEAGAGRANESTSNQATPGRTSSGQRWRPSAGSLLSALREPPYFPGLLRLPSNKTLLFPPPPRSAQPRLQRAFHPRRLPSCAYFSPSFSLPTSRRSLARTSSHPSSHLSPRRRQPTQLTTVRTPPAPRPLHIERVACRVLTLHCCSELRPTFNDNDCEVRSSRHRGGRRCQRYVFIPTLDSVSHLF